MGGYAWVCEKDVEWFYRYGWMSGYVDDYVRWYDVNLCVLYCICGVGSWVGVSRYKGFAW